MKIYNNSSDLNAFHPIVTIGIFDGVHKGHLEIIKRLKEIQLETKGETVVVTFWPHPRIVLGNNSPVFLLQSISEKINRIESTGINHLIILPFTKDFANTPFNEFIEKYLVNEIRAKHVVIGYNHHFGKDRKGGFEQLKSSGEKFHFAVEKLDPVYIDDRMVSSSEIRDLFINGKVDIANRLLGYTYSLTGKVVEGNKLGRKLGFPTANIVINEPLKLIPQNGVYAVKVEIDEHIYSGMLNIGTRPTIEQQLHNLTIEVNIFDFDTDIYGNDISIFLIKRIRNEQKFDSVDELKEQIKQDKMKVSELFSGVKKVKQIPDEI